MRPTRYREVVLIVSKYVIGHSQYHLAVAGGSQSQNQSSKLGKSLPWPFST
jgi:hypothetical protein